MSCGLRDVIGFEGLDRPAVLVASSVFERAAAEQAERLGAPGARRVFVAHPVQDRTDAELAAMAHAVSDALVEALSSRSSRGR